MMRCEHHTRFFFVFLLLLAPAVNKVFAQAALTNAYNISLYEQKDGLPQKNIVGLEMDAEGFLWIATNGGIARFDGNQFIVPSVSKEYSGNLRAFDISTVKNNVVVRMHDGHVITIKPPMNLTVEVDDLLKFGYLFTGGGVTLFPGSKWNKAREDSIKYKEWNWNIYYRHFGFAYTNDTVAIVFLNGIGLYTKDGLAARVNLGEIKDPSSLIVMGNNFLMLDQAEHKLCMYDRQGKIIQQTNIPPNTRKIIWGKEKDIFYLFTSNSIYKCSYNASQRNVDIAFLTDFSTSFNINSMLVKGEHLYIGTGGGLYVLKKNKFTNIPLLDRFNNSTGASSLMEVRDGYVLTNTDKVFTRKGFAFTVPGFTKANTRCFYRDRRNRYWYSFFDTKSATVFYTKDILARPVYVTSLPREELYSYYEASDNKIWISSYYRIGSIDPDSLKYHKGEDYVPGKNRKDDLKKVYGFAETIDKRIVLMTASGIWVEKKEKGTGVERMVDTSLLNNSEVRYMERIGNTNIFLTCTYGQGLLLADADKRKVKRISPPNTGLDFVHQFVIDNDNRYWFSTNSGLYVTTKKNIEAALADANYQPYFYRFSTADGLIDNEFDGGFQNVMIKLNNGDIVTSNSRGMVWFTPSSINFNFTGKKVTIDNIIIDGVKTEFENGIFLNDPNKNVANIQISSSDQLASENELIQFKINEAGSNNENWQTLTGSKNILLTQLKAGKYELTIRKRSGFGKDDFVYTTIPVEVKAYWYQTSIFYGLLTVIGLILIYAYFLWRNHRIRQENIKLNKKIQEATNELQELNGYLVENNEVKSKLIKMFNHDITGPLFYMKQSLQLFTSNKDIPDVYRNQMHSVTATAEELVEVGEDLLNWIQKNQYEGKIKVQPEYFSMEECFNRNMQLLSAKPNASAVMVNAAGLKDLLVYSDKNVFNSLLYNILSNAIKYSNGGAVNVNIQSQDTDDELYMLVVSNSMRKDGGRSASQVDHKDAVQLKDISRGLGLTIVQDACKLLGYDFYLDQSGEKETKVIVKNIKGISE